MFLELKQEKFLTKLIKPNKCKSLKFLVEELKIFKETLDEKNDLFVSIIFEGLNDPFVFSLLSHGLYYRVIIRKLITIEREREPGIYLS